MQRNLMYSERGTLFKKWLSMLLSGSLLAATLGLVPVSIAVAAAPSISYTANSTTPFSTLVVSGSGFAPQEHVTLSLGLSSGTATADGGGNFGGASISVPSVPAGLYYIVAVGQTSGLVAFTSLYVNSFFPQVSPSSWYISPGSTLTWTGSGFAPGEGITVTDSHSTTVASFAADGSGAFSGAGGSAIPLASRNSTATYTVHGAVSGITLSFPVTVSDLYPNVTPSTWYAVPGTPISFTGSGFGPGESINVFLGESATALTHVPADSSGSFSVPGTLTLPYNMPTAQYRFVGATSGVTASVPVTLASFYPMLSPSAYYAAPASTITVGGNGFAPNESVALSINNASVGTATADASGAIAPVSITLPGTPNTTVSLRGVGALSGATTFVSITVGQYYPNVVPSVWYTYPGNTLTFSGSGFGPNETVTMSGAASGTATTGSDGSFAGLAAKIPSSASGTANFTFTGATSGATENIGIALGVRNAAIWFDNYYAQGGSPLTVFGAGFGNNESVALSANGTSFSSAAADASGNLAARTAIPFAPSGALTITATGSDTGVTASAALTVAPVYVDFELASYAVAAGSAVTFIGHGFLPNEPVTITTDRTGSSAVASFSTDASGSFNYSSFVIPSAWADGPLTVTAHGAHSMSSTPITLWVIGT